MNTIKSIFSSIKNAFSALFKKLSSMFEEVPGIWSMMRYISWFVGTLIPATWAYLSVKKGEMLNIPESVLQLFLVAVSGKVAQKLVEKVFEKFNIKIEEKNADTTAVNETKEDVQQEVK